MGINIGLILLAFFAIFKVGKYISLSFAAMVGIDLFDFKSWAIH